MTSATDTLPPAAAPAATDESDSRRWFALGVIAIAQLMVVLDASIVTIALPSAQHSLHISTDNRQWVITAYTLAFGGFLLLGGRIADYVGRRRIFIIGLLGFAGASAIGGAAVNAPMLFGARALQGAFAALLAPAALSLITVTFTEARERATAFGVYGAIAGGGAAIGLILGGVLTEYASWRWCLLVNVPIAILTAIVALPVVHESKAHGNTSYDIPGAVTVTAGLVALVYGFTKAAESGWASITTIGYLVAAVLLLVAFVTIELKSKNPLLPMRILLERTRGAAFFTSFLATSGLMGTFLFLTFYFQGNLGYSALTSGFAFLPFSLGIIVAAGAASKLLPRTGPKALMAGGFLASTVGMLWLTQIGAHTGFVSHVLPGEVLVSIGMGLAFVPMSSSALFGVSDHDAGVASATLNTTQQIGGSLGTALLNTIFASTTAAYLATRVHNPTNIEASQIHGYSVGFVIGAVVMAVATVATLVLVKANGKDMPAMDMPATEPPMAAEPNVGERQPVGGSLA